MVAHCVRTAATTAVGRFSLLAESWHHRRLDNAEDRENDQADMTSVGGRERNTFAPRQAHPVGLRT